MVNDNTYKLLMEYNNLLKEFDDIYRGLAKKFEISECVLWILYTLRAEKTPMTQSEVCGFLYQPKQTVNSALKKMEAEGYIKLEYANDRRSKQILLTESGVLLAERTADKILNAEYNALFGMEEDEQKVFVELFRKYVKLLKNNAQSLGK